MKIAKGSSLLVSESQIPFHKEGRSAAAGLTTPVLSTAANPTLVPEIDK